MSDRTVSITLTAKDGVSKTFQQVARAGEDMNQALKRAAQDASRGMEDLGESAQSAQRPMADLKRSAQDVGLGLGVLVAGMALAGQSFRDQEIALESMRRGYGDAATEMEQFAQQIQDTTNYSNDAAVASENIFRTLAQNYGFTADEIQQLITISADLAASMGIGLEDAAMRVQAAMRGEAESAEYLGLTLNDTALGIDNMAKSTTDAEKAQIRFNALQEQSAFAMGMAQQQADSTYGTMTQLRDSVQDAAQSFGEFLGPVGEIGAFAADNAVQIAAMGLALGQLGKTAQTLNAAIGAAGLAGALGPVGIAAAAGLAAVGIYKLWEASEGMIPTAEQAAVKLGDLEQQMRELYATGNTLGELAEMAVEGIFPELSADAERIRELENAIAQTNRVIGETGETTEQQAADLERWWHELDTLTEKYGVLDSEMLSTQLSQQAVMAGMEDLSAILAHTGAGAAQAQEETKELFDQFERGEISGTMLLEDLDLIANSLDSYDKNATQAAAGTQALTEAQIEYNQALALANQTLEQYQQNQQIGGQNLASEHREAAAAIEAETEARENGIIAMQAWLDIEQQIAGNSFAAGIDVDANAAMTETWLQAQELRVQAVRQEAIEVERLQAQYAETYAEMQSIATQATDTLDSVFRAIVGNTDAIASQSQAVADWAEELIGAEGTWAQIDDLLTNGAITLDEYTAAQQAYNQIAAANVSIQEDVLSIQAQLAPVVATATEALAAQMDAIANGSTDAQLFALGMMDAATASQALALAQGYLQNQEVFGPMIQQAAELNPMLAQILEEMGMISYNPATGEVKLLGVDDAQSDLELLTSAMDDLNQTVATLIAVLQDDASGPIGDVQNLLDGLDGSTATVFANLIDNASGGIAAAHEALMALDGSSATAYITTIQQTIGGAGVFAMGGVIPQAAMGRVMRGATLVGEAGPELLLGGEGRGGLVFPATGSRESMKGMGGPLIGELHIHATGDWDEISEQVTAKLVPALQRAVGINNAGYGGRV